MRKHAWQRLQKRRTTISIQLQMRTHVQVWYFLHTRSSSQHCTREHGKTHTWVGRRTRRRWTVPNERPTEAPPVDKASSWVRRHAVWEPRIYDDDDDDGGEERGRRPITFNWQQIEARMCAGGSRLVRGRHMENRIRTSDDLVYD